MDASPAQPVAGHAVLQGADSSDYASLRRRPVTRKERYRTGRGLRGSVPRSTLGEWASSEVERDPVAQIIESHEGRLDRLVPVRVGRMAASPYGFLRGSAVVMANDLAALPSTGITPVVCGDSHLGNFGFYASPERDLVIDLNDFDEAHPGAWEWDLRRLVASIWVAGRQNGAREDACESAVRSCSAAYRDEIRHLADQPLWGARSSGWTSTECTSMPRTALWLRRSTGPSSGPATGRATGRCPGSPAEGRRPPPHPRTAAADHTLERAEAEPWPRARRLPPDPRTALAPGPRRLHAASTSRTRWSASGQRRAARVRRAAGGIEPRRRRLPAAQAGPALRAGPARARRRGVARSSGPARGRVPAGASDGQRPVARLDDDRRPAVLRAAVPQHEGHGGAGRDRRRPRSRTTRASSAPCLRRGMPAPAARR